MASKAGENVHGESPDWQKMFADHFAGGSVFLSDHETFLALFGFPYLVITELWRRYGSKCKHGKRDLSPQQWLTFLSFLRTSLSWAILSLLWRIPMSTLRQLVYEVLDQVNVMVDEVGRPF